MSRHIIRIIPLNGEWKVTFNQSLVATYTLKSVAIEKGKIKAKNNTPSQLVIHKADGTIETEYTYGNDPYPPKG